MGNQKLQSDSYRILFLCIYINTIGLIFKKNTAKLMLKIFSTPTKRVIRKKETEILNTAQKTNINYKGQNICTYSWGEGNKKAMLIHGWESNAGSLGAFVAPLLAADYQVFSFDAPAHGASGGKQTDIFEIMDIATQIINENGKMDAFIGHSLGANIILFLNKTHQMEMGKCILISPFNRMIDVFKVFKNHLSVPDCIFKKMMQLKEEKHSYSIEKLNFEAIAGDCNIKKALIIHDVNDGITPFSNAEKINNNWENATLEPIEGSGHYRTLWDENAIKIITNFIN